MLTTVHRSLNDLGGFARNDTYPIHSPNHSQDQWPHEFEISLVVRQTWSTENIYCQQTPSDNTDLSLTNTNTVTDLFGKIRKIFYAL